VALQIPASSAYVTLPLALRYNNSLIALKQTYPNERPAPVNIAGPTAGILVQAPGSPIGNPYVISNLSATSASTSQVFAAQNASNSPDAIVVALSQTGTVQVTAVADSKGNTYKQVAISTTQMNGHLWVAVGNIVALTTANTFTITYNSATSCTKTLIAIGAPGAAAIDRHQSGSGNSTAPTVSTGVLTLPYQIVIAQIASGNGANLPASLSFNLLAQQVSAQQASTVGYTITQYGNSTQTMSGTLPLTGQWSAQVVSLALWLPLELPAQNWPSNVITNPSLRFNPGLVLQPTPTLPGNYTVVPGPTAANITVSGPANSNIHTDAPFVSPVYSTQLPPSFTYNNSFTGLRQQFPTAPVPTSVPYPAPASVTITAAPGNNIHTDAPFVVPIMSTILPSFMEFNPALQNMMPQYPAAPVPTLVPYPSAASITVAAVAGSTVDTIPGTVSSVSVAGIAGSTIDIIPGSVANVSVAGYATDAFISAVGTVSQVNVAGVNGSIVVGFNAAPFVYPVTNTIVPAFMRYNAAYLGLKPNVVLPLPPTPIFVVGTTSSVSVATISGSLLVSPQGTVPNITVAGASGVISIAPSGTASGVSVAGNSGGIIVATIGSVGSVTTTGVSGIIQISQSVPAPNVSTAGYPGGFIINLAGTTAGVSVAAPNLWVAISVSASPATISTQAVSGFLPVFGTTAAAVNVKSYPGIAGILDFNGTLDTNTWNGSVGNMFGGTVGNIGWSGSVISYDETFTVTGGDVDASSSD